MGLIDFILHIDDHLVTIVNMFGNWTYLILFAIVFIETDLVFLAAAVLGDTINYEIGRWSQAEGAKHSWFNKLINQDKRKAAENFFDRHGGITIVIGRFIPFIRTFVPFVSGASKMHYGTFIRYNFLGGFLWVTLFAALGFFFGNIPVVQEHFSLIVLAIILISVVPVLIIWIKKKLVLKKELG